MSNYTEYANARKAAMDDAGKEAVAAFQSSYLFGEAVADARRQRHLTQTSLAALSGIDQADISRIESGATSPNMSTVVRLAHALNARIRLDLVEDSTPTSASTSH